MGHNAPGTFVSDSSFISIAGEACQESHCRGGEGVLPQESLGGVGGGGALPQESLGAGVGGGVPYEY